MLTLHTYAALPEDDETTRKGKASPVFSRIVHAFMGRPKLPLLTRSEERELIGLVQDTGCREAMQRLVEGHMGFITNIANNWSRRSGLEDHRDDLYEEGCLAFMRAVELYDLAHSAARLSSYAKFAVTGACLTYVREMKHPFRVATNIPDKKAFFNLPRVRTEFAEIFGRPMRHDDDDIEAAAEITGLRAISIRRAIEVEMAGPAFSPEDIQIHDMRDQDRPEARASVASGNACLEQHITGVAATLIDRDRDILMTMAGDPDAQAELIRILADRHEITVERVRQIWRGAMAEIRRSMAVAGLHRASDVR